MTVHPLRLALLVRNAEPDRFSTVVAEWFAREVENRDDFKLDPIDLARTPLTELPHRIDEADAIVIVCPEYNHGYPGDLKTAIDAVRRPWYAKPVAFIVYGGRSGGLRAAEQLRQVFGELHAVTIRETLSFHQPTDPFTAAGAPADPTTPLAAAALLDQLAWWSRSLREARLLTPYPA
ncbi:NADPH-dependent FMN reductase [Kribbella sp. CA-293567]|uniref:NADPH-dependent FMN reductase n=1 Tax=Kribbella sp. CA-293567 TaxID=3002436 RepID=UPI0022DD5343|nr:NAD(P)H-dependent oxidoreductase [Kribbella sp. CA-293567]WBQ05640.1 NAD(P)H-dependent oxidoreductase [Kribbella sp. CA-293567]